MITENAPVFSAAGDGLSALFNISFASDVKHSIPCEGTWQGDRKECRSLYIDNYNNNFSIVVETGGGNVRCPAYSQGYIDLSRNQNVVLTCDTVGGSVGVTMYTDKKPAGFTVRGNIPTTDNSDPFFDYVIGLWHFDGQNGALATQDFAVQGMGTINMNSGTALSTSWAAFGNSSLLMDTHSNTVSASSGVITCPANITVEFILNVAIASSAAANILILNGATNFLFNYQQNGLRYRITGLHGVSRVLDVGTPYRIAFVSIGNYSMLYIDGVLDVSSAVGNGGGSIQAVIQALSSSGPFKYYIDELRITAFPRYTANYSVAAKAFPDA